MIELIWSYTDKSSKRLTTTLVEELITEQESDSLKVLQDKKSIGRTEQVNSVYGSDFLKSPRAVHNI